MNSIKLLDLKTEITIHRKEFERAISRVLSSGFFILGREVKNFEQQFAIYLAVNHCIGVGNGLEAIQIALMSIGIGKGDEVITTPISAVATTLAIMAVGAKPVFVDTTEGGLINPDLIPYAITKKTKAVLPVHLYGHSVDLKKIKNICKKFKLYLIEDACQAHGSTYFGKKLGTIGDLGCFSFYPTKNLGGFGDGGAIVTNNATLAKICYQIRDYGQSSKYKHERFGLNSRLGEFQAALLSTKLSFLDENNQRRTKIARRYIQNLSVPAIKIIKPNSVSGSNFHLFVIRTQKRDMLKEFLLKNNIPTDIHYPLIIPDQPFLKVRRNDYALSTSRRFVKEILSLPMHPYLSLKQADLISVKILDFLKHH